MCVVSIGLSATKLIAFTIVFHQINKISKNLSTPASVNPLRGSSQLGAGLPIEPTLPQGQTALQWWWRLLDG